MSDDEGGEVIARVIDRTGWAAGPWDDEPDRLEWRAHGLACLIVRNDHGALCGYVGVPPGHPCHGAGYQEADATAPLEVHGGLTYASACAGHICHVPEPGEPDDVWWLGFDCGHAFDLSPGIDALLSKIKFERGCDWGQTYRDIAYVRAEVESLARQLTAVDTPAAMELQPTKEEGSE